MRYSASVVSFVLMLVAQVTYLNEELSVQDAVDRALNCFNYNPENGLVQNKDGIKSVPEFEMKHGFSIDVTNKTFGQYA